MDAIAKSLKFDPMIFGFEVLLFILLLVVMNQIYWKPMLAHLGKRDKTIKDAYDTVDAVRHEMEQLRADYQSRITRIENEARIHIQQAIKEAQSERERIVTEAKRTADEAIRHTAAELEGEKVASLESLSPRMAEMAFAAVRKALGSDVDASAVRAAIERGIAAKN